MACRAAPGRETPAPRAGGARAAANPALLRAAAAVLAVAADVLTKAWALSRLSGGRHITAVGGLIRLRLVINHGAAFGLGAGYEPLLSVVAFVSVILLGTWAVRAAGRAEGIAAALAAAGAAGNLIDRLTRPPGSCTAGSWTGYTCRSTGRPSTWPTSGSAEAC